MADFVDGGVEEAYSDVPSSRKHLRREPPRPERGCAIALQCARFSSEPDIVRASTNSPPLRRGSRGDGVHVLQLALIDLGFAMPISTKNGASLPDGVFGAETLKGAPNPTDTSSNIVIARSLPTANKQDTGAVNAIYNRRRAQLLRESKNWPPGFRTDFFT